MRREHPLIYFGFDPGGTTGFCCIWDFGDSIQLAASEEIPGGEDGLLEWAGVAEHSFPLVHKFIYEGFVLREGTFGVDITPKAVIGALKAVVSDSSRLVERAPAGRLKQVPDAILKRLGLHLPGKKNRNAREAVRHVIAYLKSQKHPVILAAFD